MNQTKEKKITKNEVKQFIFLRNDIAGYNIGAYIAQACHASVAAIDKYKHHSDTISYLEDSLHLTTIILGISVNDIENIISALTERNIDYVLWIEDENVPTCIGTRPIDVSKHPKFLEIKKKYKLFNL